MFGDVLERKLAFSVYKNIDLKGRKICIIPKGLVHCLSPKFFLLFVFGKIGQEKVFGAVLG